MKRRATAGSLRMLLVISLLLTLVGKSLSIYVEGVDRHEFNVGDNVALKVNSLRSIRTQVPMDYYSLPFCKPKEGVNMDALNLGEKLSGDKVQNSPYAIYMLVDAHCQVLCHNTLLSKEAESLKWYITHDYHNNWILDNLPSARTQRYEIGWGRMQTRYGGGFSLGFLGIQNDQVYVYNHVNIHIDYHGNQPMDTHQGSANSYVILRFRVEPISVKHKVKEDISNLPQHPQLATCEGSTPLEQSSVLEAQLVEPGKTIVYTYDVIWHKSEDQWSTRWNIYLSEDYMVPAILHWNEVRIGLFVLFLISMTFVRTLRSVKEEIAQSEEGRSLIISSGENGQSEETGWKAVQGDVFRPPERFTTLYCVLVGTGVQLGCTLFLSVFFSALGVLNPARRGSLIMFVLASYSLCGAVAGYISCRLYKVFDGPEWKRCLAFTAIFFPGFVLTIRGGIQLFLLSMGSTGALGVLDIVIVLILSFFVHVPLVALGGYVGNKQEMVRFPTPVSTIPRKIPPPSNSLRHPHLSIAACGALLVFVIRQEFFLVMTHIWMYQYYYVFGFLILVCLILGALCGTSTSLLVFWQVSQENHRWWWLAFWAPGSLGAFMFLYSFVWFMILCPAPLLVTALIYFGYMGLVCLGMSLIFGSIGSLTSLWFLRRLYLLYNREE